MRSKRKWLVLFWLTIILGACTPAESLPQQSDQAMEAISTPESTVKSPRPTSILARPTDVQTPVPKPTQTLLDLEIAPDTPTKSAPAQEIIPMPQGSTPVPPTDSVSLALIDKAKSDLAQRTGIPEEEIALEYFAYGTWPNASLGCPEPGMVYAEVLVDGYQIVLRAGLDVYSYHGATSGSSPFLCEGIGEKISVPPPLDSLER